jgi:hypothetical protein
MHGSMGNLVELLNKCINGGKYRGISLAYGIPYRRFTYRGSSDIPFISVYRATLASPKNSVSNKLFPGTLGGSRTQSLPVRGEWCRKSD